MTTKSIKKDALLLSNLQVHSYLLPSSSCVHELPVLLHISFYWISSILWNRILSLDQNSWTYLVFQHDQTPHKSMVRPLCLLWLYHSGFVVEYTPYNSSSFSTNRKWLNRYQLTRLDVYDDSHHILRQSLKVFCNGHRKIKFGSLLLKAIYFILPSFTVSPVCSIWKALPFTEVDERGTSSSTFYSADEFQARWHFFDCSTLLLQLCKLLSFFLCTVLLQRLRTRFYFLWHAR